MKKLAIPFLAVVLSCGGLAVPGSFGDLTNTARADDAPSYMVFRVRNNTDRPIQYQVDWNGQGWVSYTVQPGTFNSHYDRWLPGHPFPYVSMIYDNQHGAWTPVFTPAAAVGQDPLNGGFSNNFVLVNGGNDIALGSSSD